MPICFTPQTAAREFLKLGRGIPAYAGAVCLVDNTLNLEQKIIFTVVGSASFSLMDLMLRQIPGCERCEVVSKIGRFAVSYLTSFLWLVVYNSSSNLSSTLGPSGQFGPTMGTAAVFLATSECIAYVISKQIARSPGADLPRADLQRPLILQPQVEIVSQEPDKAVESRFFDHEIEGQQDSAATPLG